MSDQVRRVIMEEKPVGFLKDPFVFAKAIMALEHEIFLRFGVALSDGLILAELSEIPRLKMSDIARKIFSSRPAATGCVKHLITKGLVKRYRSNDDRRVIWVKITPKGDRLLRSIRNCSLFRGGKFRLYE